MVDFYYIYGGVPSLKKCKLEQIDNLTASLMKSFASKIKTAFQRL